MSKTKRRIRPGPTKGEVLCVDLFAGAGGFSLGAREAGARVHAAIEIDHKAAQSYRLNLIKGRRSQTKLFERDILSLPPASFMKEAQLAPAECDLLLGGPPCQGFSSHRLNGAGVGDPRNRLLLRYFEYVRALRPLYFLVENVPGLLWPRHASFIRTFYSTAAAAGYEVMQPVILDAKDFGVPQNRRRVFILGYDKNRGISDPSWPPTPTHGPSAGKPWVTAAEVFQTPAPPDDPNDVHMNHGDALRQAFSNTPKNGGSRSQSGRVLECHTGHAGHFDVYGRIDPSKPAPTMTTACINPSKGRFVHPTLDHGITLRQAARVQTFPDWFTFEGGLMAGGVQIGNAVPVRLAKALLQPLVRAIESARETGSKDLSMTG